MSCQMDSWRQLVANLQLLSKLTNSFYCVLLFCGKLLVFSAVWDLIYDCNYLLTTSLKQWDFVQLYCRKIHQFFCCIFDTVAAQPVSAVVVNHICCYQGNQRFHQINMTEISRITALGACCSHKGLYRAYDYYTLRNMLCYCYSNARMPCSLSHPPLSLPNLIFE